MKTIKGIEKYTEIGENSSITTYEDANMVHIEMSRKNRKIILLFSKNSPMLIFETEIKEKTTK